MTAPAIPVVARTDSNPAFDRYGAVKAGGGSPKTLPQDLTIAVAPHERARGQLSPETERAACAAFRTHGCAILRGVFPLPLIEAMYHDYRARYGALDTPEAFKQAMKTAPSTFATRGDARFQVTPRLNGALGAPEVFANSLLRRILVSLLREDMQLNSFTLVVSLPGASLQPVHSDFGHLYSEPGVVPILPVYAINVIVPLIDVDLAGGPTGLWPGSHRWPANIRPQPETVSAGAIQRGDCLLLDYRTLHTGLPNRSASLRPIACRVYARSWFFDDLNYQGNSSFDLTLEDYRKLPQSAHPLLVRALSQATRGPARDAEPIAPARAVERSLQDPASPAKVGRNDTCPCGSGRKFKHCHGRLA
jgi:hypothetical protein